MNAKWEFSVMLPPSIAKPHWSGLPSPLVSLVSFFAVSTNSDQVLGGCSPASSNSFLL